MRTGWGWYLAYFQGCRSIKPKKGPMYHVDEISFLYTASFPGQPAGPRPFHLSSCFVNLQARRIFAVRRPKPSSLPRKASPVGHWPSALPVLGLDVVGEGLGLLVAVVVVVAVAVVLGSDVLHLVDAAALGASLHRSLAGHLHGPWSAFYLAFSRAGFLWLPRLGAEEGGKRTPSQFTTWESAG